MSCDIAFKEPKRDFQYDFVQGDLEMINFLSSFKFNFSLSLCDHNDS